MIKASKAHSHLISQEEMCSSLTLILFCPSSERLPSQGVVLREEFVSLFPERQLFCMWILVTTKKKKKKISWRKFLLKIFCVRYLTFGIRVATPGSQYSPCRRAYCLLWLADSQSHREWWRVLPPVNEWVTSMERRVYSTGKISVCSGRSIGKEFLWGSLSDSTKIKSEQYQCEIKLLPGSQTRSYFISLMNKIDKGSLLPLG